MKKEEFLKELKRRLKGLPKDDLENRIRFYGEMIDDRIDDGMSEEDAVKEVGTVDEVVAQIAAETPLARLVKERTKPKRSLRAWEIILLILGFPLWFPLALTALILCLVGYLLIWVLDIVVYAVELAFAHVELSHVDHPLSEVSGEQCGPINVRGIHHGVLVVPRDRAQHRQFQQLFRQTHV